MFHLEDFMEKLELLPDEVKSELEKIGKLDLEVEQSMDTIKRDVDNLFSKADHLNPNDLNQTFNSIMKKGEKAIELSDNKVQATNNMQDLLQKYMNRLDVDLLNFRQDLEDQYGEITEDIEKRVLSSNESHKTIQKENEFQLKKCLFEGKQSEQSSSNEELNVDSDSSPEYSKTNLSLQGRMITGSNSPRGEKNCAKKLFTPRSSLGNELAGKDKADGKKKTTTKNLNKPIQSTTAKSTMNNEDKSNEPRYCTCNEVAYDKMVACDNTSCPYEWFHFGCVGITRQPVGKWYCSYCSKKMKKRQRK